MYTIDRINFFLKEKGMTGAELSRLIGVSTAVYSQWNKRKTKPSNKSIVKVAEALGVSVSEITGEDQKENPPAQGGGMITLSDFEKALEGKTQDELRQIMEIVMRKFTEGNGK